MSDRRIVSADVGLTRAQQLIWAAQKMSPEAPIYNMAMTFRLEGRVDAERMNRAVRRLIGQADALRTVLTELEGFPGQSVKDEMTFSLETIELGHEADAASALQRWAKERCAQPLPLHERTFDIALVRLRQDDALYLCQHHVLTDAGSFAILFDRLASLYEEQGAESTTRMGPLPAFAEYVQAEHQARSELSSADVELTNRPLTYYGVDAKGQGTSSGRVEVELTPEEAGGLRERASEPGVAALTPDMSMFRVILTLAFAYIHRVTAAENIVIGAPAHNRVNATLRDTVGLLTEVYPLEINVSPTDTFSSLFGKVVEAVDDYLRSARPGGSSSALNRSVDTFFNYLPTTFGAFAGYESTAEWVTPGHMEPEHVLRFHVADFTASGRISLLLDFSQTVIHSVGADNIESHLRKMLGAMTSDWNGPILGFSLLTPEEERLVVNGDRSGGGIGDGSVVQMFSSRVAEAPDAVAMVEGDVEWTYSELDRLTKSGAARLTGNEVVGIMLARSAEAVISMMSTLRSGAAYVMIDPMWPQARIDYILDNARCDVVIANGDLVRIATLSFTELVSGDASKELAEVEPTDLAYVLYTSGSTGEPKGVMIEHGALANYVSWARDFYDKGRQLTFPLFSTLTFDLTVTSVLVPLTSGGSIVVYPEKGESFDLSVREVFEDDRVDIVKLTPSHLGLLPDDRPVATRVSQLILGGEDLTTAAARAVASRFDTPVEIHNEYGPTEATVGCVAHTFDADADSGASVPIGRAIAGMCAFVLNEVGQASVPGVPGELWLGGVGVARGYINEPHLTAERFQTIEPVGRRLYRTGDLARLRRDGTIEYLGRRDDQVKVRGVRVELGEIEAAITSHPQVTMGAVRLHRRHRATQNPTGVHCVRCGLSSTYPGVDYDADGVCDQCRAYSRFADRARVYFQPSKALKEILEAARSTTKGEHDCVALLSGGKDSTYALARLVDMGARPLAFTLDNGFISEGAKDNIKRVCEALKVDHVYGSTPAMNEIFVDSLQRHANVCNGCFKTIYTLSMQLARERGIPLIVTGLSRGQFFETRLTADLFADQAVTADQIDAKVLEARRAYHRVDDAPRRLLDIAIFDEGDIFEDVQFVDFYRYCDDTLDEMMAYLDLRLPWIRPRDTGRSTNCLINDVGIYVHKAERGYHNYALPYSWDVRLGHKTRDQAISELEDHIDPDRVDQVLAEIGYPENIASLGWPEALVGYYVSTEPIPAGDLRRHLESVLPEGIIPSRLIPLETIPLTANGKLDREALPNPAGHRPETVAPYVTPSTDDERQLTKVWCEVLGLDSVGVRDRFFDLGGDSIMAIQIAARAKRAGIDITLRQLFEHQTISALAAAAGTRRTAAERFVGRVELTPIQRWFFDTVSDPRRFNQVVELDFDEVLDEPTIVGWLDILGEQHPALRQRFWRQGSQWLSEVIPEWTPPAVERADLGRSHVVSDRINSWLASDFDLGCPPLMRMVLFDREEGGSRLTISAHHGIVDAVSWDVLVDDLEHIADQTSDGSEPRLPVPSDSVQQWMESIREMAGSLSAANWTQIMHSATPLTGHETASPEKLRTHVPTGLLEEALQNAPIWRIEIDELVLAAFVTSLAGFQGRNEVRVFMEGHGRHSGRGDVDVTRTLGWFTALFPQLFAIPSPDDWAGILRETKEKARLARSRGIEFGVLADSNQDLAFRPQSEALFNYLGRATPVEPVRRVRQAGPIELIAQADVRPIFGIELNTWIDGDGLTLDWLSRCNEVSLRQLAPDTSDNLQSLIAACRDGEANELVTPADFPNANLNRERMSKLASLLHQTRAR